MVPVYNRERELNLGDLVSRSGSIAYVNNLKSNSELLVPDDILKSIKLSLAYAESFDLYPVSTVLVSVGWNKNDDVFLREEAWAAKDTPEDKPFNLEHNPRHIIGHITNNIAVDVSNAIIGRDVSLAQVPDKFHIVTNAVIYKHVSSRDEALEKEAAELIAGIQNGEWFVSMECLFTDFDYGILYSSGEAQVVARNESTAFLTKHLRVYGGYGEYNGGKLGRVLRNITFTGKGLVRNPANPESIIFDRVLSFAGVTINNDVREQNGENIMAENKLDEKVAELQAKLDEANARIVELAAAEVKTAEADIAKAQEKAEAAQAKADELATRNEELVAEKATLETKATELEAKLVEATEKLAEIEKTNIANMRICSMVDAGVAKEDAEQIVADFSTLSDEQFEKIAKMQIDLAAEKKMKKEEKEEKEDKEEYNKDEAETKCDEDEKRQRAKSDEEDAEGEKAAEAANLDNAEPEAEESLASDNNSEDAEKEFMESLASFLESKMHVKTK